MKQVVDLIFELFCMNTCCCFLVIFAVFGSEVEEKTILIAVLLKLGWVTLSLHYFCLIFFRLASVFSRLEIVFQFLVIYFPLLFYFFPNSVTEANQSFNFLLCLFIKSTRLLLAHFWSQDLIISSLLHFSIIIFYSILIWC